MVLSVDRIEGNMAVCIDTQHQQHVIPLSTLPEGTSEGAILHRTTNGYALDVQDTTHRRQAIAGRLSRLGADSRRSAVTTLLEQTTQPVSASVLAEKFRVSRQIIVGDIALLRAAGAPIVATPRGYLIEAAMDTAAQDYTVACRHDTIAQLLQELYIAVDQGAIVRDVIIEHPTYGQLTGQLQIGSRFEAERFVETLSTSEASPLSQLTGGIHLHTLRCPDRACFERILAALKEAGILVLEE
ncbi:MAG: 3H domain-containing protein [Candidatus Fimivivens sp.]